MEAIILLTSLYRLGGVPQVDVKLDALENDLEVIPVINKIDLPSADIEMVKHHYHSILFHVLTFYHK